MAQLLGTQIAAGAVGAAQNGQRAGVCAQYLALASLLACLCTPALAAANQRYVLLHCPQHNATHRTAAVHRYRLRLRCALMQYRRVCAPSSISQRLYNHMLAYRRSETEARDRAHADCSSAVCACEDNQHGARTHPRMHLIRRKR